MKASQEPSGVLAPTLSHRASMSANAVGSSRNRSVAATGQPDESVAKPRVAKICLVGNFGSSNLGNEGTLSAMLDVLRRHFPDADLVCACWPPESLEKQHGIRGISLQAPRFRSLPARIANRLSFGSLARIATFVHAVRTIRQNDIAIVPGTGILDDFGETWRGMPLMIFTWALAARVAGRPFWFVSIGAGPIRNRVSRWLMRSAAKLAHYRSYRDQVSKKYMQSIGLDTTKDPVVPDLAFGLPVAAASPREKTDERLRVGVGIMAYRGWFGHHPDAGLIYDHYTAKMARFTAWLLGQGHAVRLLIGETCDADAIADVISKLPPEVRSPAEASGDLITEPASSLADIKRQMMDTDLVVTTRYHNVVCAFGVGKPILSISYAAKNDELLTEAGLGEFCQHIERLDVDLLIAQFKRLVAERDDYTARVEQAAAGFRARLADQEAQLVSVLNPV